MNGAGGALWSSHASDARVFDQLSMICTVVHDDESSESRDVEAFFMRGAQREITGYLISQGYEPPGRRKTRGSVLNEGRSRPNVRLGIAKELE